jgi:hypothetical protein
LNPETVTTTRRYRTAEDFRAFYANRYGCVDESDVVRSCERNGIPYEAPGERVDFAAFCDRARDAGREMWERVSGCC